LPNIAEALFECGLTPGGAADAEEFYDNEEDDMFGNYSLLYDEVESYSRMMIQGEYLDNYLSWEITDALGYQLPIEEDDFNTMFIQFEDAFYLFAVNSCSTYHLEIEQIPAIDVRFRVNSGIDANFVWVDSQDEYEYNEDASYAGLIEAESERIYFSFDDSDGFFDDHFLPGEVNIYRLQPAPDSNWHVPSTQTPTLFSAYTQASNDDTIFVYQDLEESLAVGARSVVFMGIGSPSPIITSDAYETFHVGPPNEVQFINLRLQNHDANRNIITNEGELVLIDCSFDGSLAGGITGVVNNHHLSAYRTDFLYCENGIIGHGEELNLFGCEIKASEYIPGYTAILCEDVPNHHDKQIILDHDPDTKRECVIRHYDTALDILCADQTDVTEVIIRNTRLLRDDDNDCVVLINSVQGHQIDALIDNCLLHVGFGSRVEGLDELTISQSTLLEHPDYLSGSQYTIDSSIMPDSESSPNYSSATISRCFFQGDGDPGFVDPDNGDYCLRWDSPCLDAGDPSLEFRDQDHTPSDIGYNKVYRHVDLVNDVADYTQLEKGVYYATDEVYAASGFVLPSGSTLLLGPDVDLTIYVSVTDVFIGDQEDTERTVVTFYNPSPDPSQQHIPPGISRGDLSIGGTTMPPEGDRVFLNHVVYIESEADLELTDVFVEINDLRFCLDCSDPNPDLSTMKGCLHIGDRSTGTIQNSVFRGSELGAQVFVSNADVEFSSCEFLDYINTGLLLLDYGHNVDYGLHDLTFVGANDCVVGITSINSGFRLTQSVIEDHTSYGMNGSFSWFDMHREAHNDITGNSFPDYDDGQIYLFESNCQLDCGTNRISSDGSGDFQLIRDPSGLIQESTDVSYNDWGVDVSDPSNPRLLPTCWGVLYWEPLYNWGEIPPFDCVVPNIPAELFALGNWQEINGDTQAAILTYKYIMVTYPTDDYASRAAFRLKYISGKGYDEGMTVKAEYEEALVAIGDQNPDLTYFLEGSYWVLYGKLVNKEEALDALQNLIDQSNEDDARTYYELRYAYLVGWDGSGGSFSEADPLVVCQRVQTELARQSVYIEQALEICGLSTGESPSIPELPREFYLGQNYPNPFNSSTTIVYSVPNNCELTLTVYNAIGQQVTLLAEGLHTAGNYSLVYDCSDLASGLYFCRLHTEDFTKTKKMMLIK